MVQSVMVLAFILLPTAFGAASRTSSQIKRIKTIEAEGIEHDEGVSEDFLIQMWRCIGDSDVPCRHPRATGGAGSFDTELWHVTNKPAQHSMPSAPTASHGLEISTHCAHVR